MACPLALRAKSRTEPSKDDAANILLVCSLHKSLLKTKGVQAMRDAIETLREDHHKMQQLFQKFEESEDAASK